MLWNQLKSVWQHWEHPLNPLAIVQIMTTTFHATASILNSFAQLTLKPQDSSEIRHSFEAFASRCFGSVDTASSHLTLSLPLPGFYIEDISCSKVILRTWQNFIMNMMGKLMCYHDRSNHLVLLLFLQKIIFARAFWLQKYI